MKLSLMVTLFVPIVAGTCFSAHKKKNSVEPAPDRTFVKSLNIQPPLDTARSLQVEEEILQDKTPRESHTPTPARSDAYKQYIIVLNARTIQQILNAKS